MKLALLIALILSLGCAMTLGKVTPIQVGDQIGYECKGLGLSFGKASACGTESDEISEGAASMAVDLICIVGNAYNGSCDPDTEDSDD